jgi:transposase
MSATTTRNDPTSDFDAATERVREANDRLTEAGRKVTTAYLDGVERYVVGLAEAERKLAREAQFAAVGDLLKAHATVTEEVVRAGVAATRELIRA